MDDFSLEALRIAPSQAAKAKNGDEPNERSFKSVVQAMQQWRPLIQESGGGQAVIWVAFAILVQYHTKPVGGRLCKPVTMAHIEKAELGLSTATIYRALEQLKVLGLIKEVQWRDRYKEYTPRFC
jgi:hypothetical protein